MGLMDVGKMIAKGAKGLAGSTLPGQILSLFDAKMGIPPAKRAEMEQEVRRLVAQTEGEYETSYRVRLQVVSNIIKAELESGSWYNKGARPTVVYGGLLMIFVNYTIAPLLGRPPTPLPTDFWLAWGGIVAAYSIGRDRNRGLKAREIKEKLEDM